MKKCILIFTLLALALLAANAQPKNPTLPDDYQYGRVPKYVGKTTEENNMISQFNTYFYAMSRNDISGVSPYVYPDIIKYYKRYAPSYYSDKDIIRDLTTLSSTNIENVSGYFSDIGLNFEIIIDSLVRKISTGDALIYVFTIVSNVYNETFSIHTAESDPTIGFSFNKGVNWTFLDLNDDTPNILRLRFNQDIINQIMGY